jgi:hypothetical protein
VEDITTPGGVQPYRQGAETKWDGEAEEVAGSSEGGAECLATTGKCRTRGCYVSVYPDGPLEGTSALVWTTGARPAAGAVDGTREALLCL